MTGVTLKINFDDRALRQALKRLQRRTETAASALHEIGEYFPEAAEAGSSDYLGPVLN